MENGVKIILERMKTNPEEFEGITTGNRWGRLIADYQDILNPEEIQAIKDGLRRINLDRFNEKVLKALMIEEPTELEVEPWEPFSSAPMRMAGSTVTYDSKTQKLEDAIRKKREENEKERIKQLKLEALTASSGGTITYKTKGRYKT